MNYYPHHIGDFIRDTSRLNDSQTMAYLRLLWLYYESESPLNNDPGMLAFKIGSDSDTVQMLLKAFFKLSGSEWHQIRCESEIRKYQKKAESANRANKARWSEHDLKSEAEQTQDQIATNNQEPITKNHKPKTINQEPIKASEAAKASSVQNAEIWNSYSTAYFQKYGVEPVRNAKINGQIANLGKRLGREASFVAAWFLCHKNGWYAQKMHSLDCLLTDAEKLRTEWATGQQMTKARANSIDKSTGGGNVFLQIAEERKSNAN